MTQHFEQALVIGDIGFSTVGEKRKTQCIHRQMSFNTIGAFVFIRSPWTRYWRCRYSSPLGNQ
nr:MULTISPECIES: hypothetical protein [unclassified Coleofasciculus]